MSAQIREAITKLGKVLEQDPKKGRSRNPSATARIAGGLVCDVTGPKGESLKTDMPAAAPRRRAQGGCCEPRSRRARRR
jgi:hypothetical protein